uniref:30S ribosomal protein S16, chloroplastic n=3 Tax=Calocedrus TaxID=13386 RepID=V5YR99_CALFM|nr:ribosomal protein S16 [Calocedrus formosana]YP_009758655.1 ribosomal protein S16 [Calocedrus rupestris]AQM38877.1 ribosomal protein S16 [Calocedrus macrolepis]AQM38794.1 ribosomal protein S16 [Calocedrus formosana]QIN90472.1 ribosomal protein S16 [Calocedrus rupestris]BAO19858.1 ribosomal protein S16 [Calocedrus formosana]
MIKIRLKRCGKKQHKNETRSISSAIVYFLKSGTQLTKTFHGIFLQKFI